MRIEFNAPDKDVAMWRKAAKADGRSLSALLRKAATREAIAIMTWACKVIAKPARRSKR